MESNVMVQGGLSAILADTTAGEFAGATTGLFINNVDPGKQAVDGDLDAATFTGSTPVVITWGEVYINANGDPEQSSQLIQFDWDAGATETVYGIKVKSAGAGTPLLLYARMDAPKEMAATTDSVSFVVRLTMSATGFGASIQVSE